MISARSGAFDREPLEAAIAIAFGPLTGAITPDWRRSKRSTIASISFERIRKSGRRLSIFERFSSSIEEGV
jgi:hypothetical protein